MGFNSESGWPPKRGGIVGVEPENGIRNETAVGPTELDQSRADRFGRIVHPSTSFSLPVRSVKWNFPQKTLFLT
jgi:hypothetical protein